MNTNNISEFPVLAKLHGSINTGTIIPPTWNKGLNHAEIILAWKLAYKLLMQANHIRIIGYSLPETDSYIKYLLRAAVVHAPHLKTIDVLCLDPNDSTIKKRYNDFILFKNYRFLSANVEDYLKHIMSSSKKSRVEHQQPRQVIFDTPENAHNSFFEKQPS